LRKASARSAVAAVGIAWQGGEADLLRFEQQPGLRVIARKIEDRAVGRRVGQLMIPVSTGSRRWPSRARKVSAIMWRAVGLQPFALALVEPLPVGGAGKGLGYVVRVHVHQARRVDLAPVRDGDRDRVRSTMLPRWK